MHPPKHNAARVKRREKRDVGSSIVLTLINAPYFRIFSFWWGIVNGVFFTLYKSYSELRTPYSRVNHSRCWSRLLVWLCFWHWWLLLHFELPRQLLQLPPVRLPVGADIIELSLKDPLSLTQTRKHTHHISRSHTHHSLTTYTTHKQTHHWLHA